MKISAGLLGSLFLALSLLAAESQITENYLHLLKGKWEGKIIFPAAKGELPRSGTASLEIFNDSLPLEGVFTDFFKHPFNNGILKEGRLSIQWGDQRRISLGLDVFEVGGLSLKGEIVWTAAKESRKARGSAKAHINLEKRERLAPSAPRIPIPP